MINNKFTDYNYIVAECGKWEGIRLEAYLDVANVPTIGYGTTVYPSGAKVKMGDKCTKEEAASYLQSHLKKEVQPVIESVVTKQLRKCQWEALSVLIYNIGSGNFRKSTLLKTINTDPDSEDIGENWIRFIKAGGKKRRGLLRRRLSEVFHYFDW